MPEHSLPPTRYAPALNLPAYAYVPGHGLPHPVNDPDGHLYATRDAGDAQAPPLSGVSLAALPSAPEERRRALVAALTRNHAWLHALDLFNAGFYWEAHEAWEAFWHALGRVTPEARFIQGLIHLAAACVKIREGKPAGVTSHTQRARELVGDVGQMDDGGSAGDGLQAGGVGSLGIVPESLAAVVAELENARPACWHTSRFPVVKVLAAELRLTSSDG
jgi:hypothetical protein